MLNKFIFIGPDRSGKTTIAKAFAEQHGFQYYKNTDEGKLFRGDTNIDFATHCNVGIPLALTFLKQIEPVGGLVMDRFTPCEYAYGHTFNRVVNEDLIWWADNELFKLGFWLVYCYKLKYDAKKWDDDPIKLAKMKDLKFWYQRYLMSSRMSSVSIETSDENLEWQLRLLGHVMKGN